jgi:hypothetical protein
VGHYGSDGYWIAVLGWAGGWGGFLFFSARDVWRSWRCTLFLLGSKVCFFVCQKIKIKIKIYKRKILITKIEVYDE